MGAEGELYEGGAQRDGSFEVGFDGEDCPFLEKKPSQYPERFYYREYSVPGIGARIAVCSTDGEFGEICHVALG